MNSTGIIVFFIPPKKIINGGILSIFSLCKESRRFSKIHNCEVLLCTYPGNKTYTKNDLFENQETVYSFEDITKKYKNVNKIIFHIPETSVKIVANALINKYAKFVKNIDSVHINVLTQNIDLLPEPVEFGELFRMTDQVTQTTAHPRYTTQKLSDKYHTPVHHFSVFNDVRQYNPKPFMKKRNLILYSNDYHPNKNKILMSVKNLGSFELLEVNNVPYEEYKHLAAEAKFSITFREGFSGYFVDSFFSGSIGFGVYNESFFPDKSFLSDLPSVFESYSAMEKNIAESINNLNNEQVFAKYSSLGKTKIEKFYDFNNYLNNIKAFYKGNYDISPRSSDARDLLVDLINKKDIEIKKLKNIQEDYESQIVKLNKDLAKTKSKHKETRQHLINVLESRSWKITKPLRKINAK